MKDEDVCIKKANLRLFEGVILNAGELDRILSVLDLETSINYKMRRKLATAVIDDYDYKAKKVELKSLDPVVVIEEKEVPKKSKKKKDNE